MSWSSVIILVPANDFEEAESAALQIFETEGIIVCDGSYEIETDSFDVTLTLAGYEALKSEDFLEKLQKQIDDYQSKLSELIGWNPEGYWSLKDVRNTASQYSDYLTSLISFSTKIYDGEDCCPVLDLFKVEENPNNYFFVTIKYHH